MLNINKYPGSSKNICVIINRSVTALLFLQYETSNVTIISVGCLKIIARTSCIQYLSLQFIATN